MKILLTLIFITKETGEAIKPNLKPRLDKVMSKGKNRKKPKQNSKPKTNNAPRLPTLGELLPLLIDLGRAVFEFLSTQ